MELDVIFNGLDKVDELIEQARKQMRELCDTTFAIRSALAELGIEVSPPEATEPAEPPVSRQT